MALVPPPCQTRRTSHTLLWSMVTSVWLRVSTAEKMCSSLAEWMLDGSIMWGTAKRHGNTQRESLTARACWWTRYIALMEPPPSATAVQALDGQSSGGTQECTVDDAVAPVFVPDAAREPARQAHPLHAPIAGRQ